MLITLRLSSGENTKFNYLYEYYCDKIIIVHYRIMENFFIYCAA